MSDFVTGNNYFCDALGGVVLHVNKRAAFVVDCFILSCCAINDFGARCFRDGVLLNVQRAAISQCEFVECRIFGSSLTFFASERCSAFTLADFRDNFVNYSPF
ncbi:MAG: hypothetical protein IJG38_04675 [Thermoguttaceae bacterium]|nr:hypothetical protein [Thermoguttaceae bacterium]